MSKLIIIRHCKADGQEPEAQLTTEGYEQSKELANFLEQYNIRRIISSPFKRTIQTITPYASKSNLPIEMDDRLKERVLSSENLPDWFEKLELTFQDMNLKFTGGESSNEATNRIVSVINELKNSEAECIALITHGNLFALLLNYLSQDFSFEKWQQLSNPDVYVVELQSSTPHYRRIWEEAGAKIPIQ